MIADRKTLPNYDLTSKTPVILRRFDSAPVRFPRTLFLCCTYKSVKSIIIKCENVVSMLEAEKFGVAACRAAFDEMIDAV